MAVQFEDLFNYLRCPFLSPFLRVYLTGLILPLFLREERILSNIVFLYFFEVHLQKKKKNSKPFEKKGFSSDHKTEMLLMEKDIFAVQDTGFVITLLAIFPLPFT